MVIAGVGAVVDDAVPVLPAATSSEPDVATPLNSATVAPAAFAADRVTVAKVTAGAPVRYHSSVRVLEPREEAARRPSSTCPSAESVTPVTEAVAPAWMAIAATSVSPPWR